MKWYLKVWKQYADFKGRARRKEFWMFALLNMIIYFVAGLLIALLFVASMRTFNFWLPFIGYILLGCYNLAILVPSLAVLVRRLHDIGKSGWYFLVAFIPLVGGIILLIWSLQDSQPNTNKWGANPKIADDNEDDITASPPNYYPRLQCKSGYDNFTYNIVNPRTTIGRERDNNLILSHPTVSKHHAEIVSTGVGFEIIDKGSTNRVIVNGQFFQRTMLRNGDIIGLGEAVLTFYM